MITKHKDSGQCQLKYAFNYNKATKHITPNTHHYTPQIYTNAKASVFTE